MMMRVAALIRRARCGYRELAKEEGSWPVLRDVM